MRIAAADPTFSDSPKPNFLTATFWLIIPRLSDDKPWASLPRTKTQYLENLTLAGSAPRWSPPIKVCVLENLP